MYLHIVYGKFTSQMTTPTLWNITWAVLLPNMEAPEISNMQCLARTKYSINKL